MKRKNWFSSVALLTLISTSVVSFHPKESRAILTAVTGAGGIALLALGGLLGVGGFVSSGIVWDSDGDHLGLSTGLSGVGILGALILDDTGAISPRFTELSSDESAAKLSISADERQAYNSELPQINAIYQSVIQDAAEQSRKNQDEKAVASYADRRWNDYDAVLSPEARFALERVRQNLATVISHTR